MRVFTVNSFENGEWRDYTILENKFYLGLVIPPPEHSAFVGMQGLLTFTKRDMWQIRHITTRHALGTLTDPLPKQWKYLQDILQDSLVLHTLIQMKEWRDLLLDSMILSMFDCLSLFNPKSAKYLYHCIKNNSSATYKSFINFINRILKRGFGDYAYFHIKATEYTYCKYLELQDGTEIELEELEFEAEDSINLDLATKFYLDGSTIDKLQYTPLTWLCGKYYDNNLVYIEHLQNSADGEEILVTAGGSKKKFKTKVYFEELQEYIEELFKIFNQDNSNLEIIKSKYSYEEFYSIIESLLYTNAMTHARLELGEYNSLAYDNRFA